MKKRDLEKRIQELERKLADVERHQCAPPIVISVTIPEPIPQPVSPWWAIPGTTYIPCPTTLPWPGYPGPYIGDPIPNPFPIT